jgi:hypothetical protein
MFVSMERMLLISNLVAVLGLHAIFNRAVPIDGKIEIRPVRSNIASWHSCTLLTAADDEYHTHIRSSPH